MRRFGLSSVASVAHVDLEVTHAMTLAARRSRWIAELTSPSMEFVDLCARGCMESFNLHSMLAAALALPSEFRFWRIDSIIQSS
jgi:hypothetical protein